MSRLKTPERNGDVETLSPSLSELTQPSKSALDFIAEELVAPSTFIGASPRISTLADAVPLVATMGAFPAQPPALDSPRLEAELLQVRALAAQSDRHGELSLRWNQPANRSWGEVASDFVTVHTTSAVAARRIFDLLAIAHHDAIVITGRAKEEFLRPAPDELDSSIETSALREHLSAYPSGHAAIAAASRTILLEFFPSERSTIDQLFFDHLSTRIAAGVSFPSDLSAGAEIGHHVGTEILEYGSRTPLPEDSMSEPIAESIDRKLR